MEEVNYDILQKLALKKILVIGDIMLDQYYYGTINRISPEAPVPVVKVEDTKGVLGGAANVANNLSKLGCRTYLIGTVGQDSSKNKIYELLEEQAINYNGIFVTEKPTITKIRVVGINQQVVRIDFEDNSETDDNIAYKIKNYLISLINEEKIDAVIVSDYNKGMVTEELCQFIINNCTKNKIPVIIDPKGTNWNKYNGADLVTPNIKEISDIFNEKILNNDDQIIKFGRQAKLEYNIKNLLITRSEKGMTLLTGDYIKHFPTVAQEVFDVSGAGDTVAAILTAMISLNVDYVEAVNISNIAAGIAVGHKGTYAVSIEELLSKIDNNSNYYSNKKLISFSEIEILSSNLKKQKKEIVFTNGCFDILHVGHVTYLEKAKQLGDILIIGLNSDNSVKKLKGDSRPINSEIDRAKLLGALAFVDYIVIFDEDTPKNLIEKINPDYLVKGADYQLDQVIGREYAKEVVLIDFEKGYSTTNIINKIKR